LNATLLPMRVLNPVGYPPRVNPKPLAPRLDTLDGKKVYLVDCRFDDSELLLRQVGNWFASTCQTSRPSWCGLPIRT
jgi:hypothetical protein